MCYGCYENANKPSIINEKTKKAAQLIDEIYECDNGGAGGYAHIVVDDWNLNDSSIDSCIEDAIKGEYEHLEEVKEASIICLKYLKELTIEERYSAMALHENFIK